MAWLVQCINVKGNIIALPTLPVASKSQDNLADLLVAVIHMVAVCGGVEAQELWYNINFTLSNSTYHNIGLVNVAATVLELQHMQDQLLRHVHVMYMFSNQLLKVFSDIEDTVGNDKVYASCLLSPKYAYYRWANSEQGKPIPTVSSPIHLHGAPASDNKHLL